MIGRFISNLKKTFSYWTKDRASILGAALAYYTVFSLAPLLVVIISIVGFFFGQQAAEGEVVRGLSGLLGHESAKTVQSVVAQTDRPTGENIISFILGIILLLVGASGIFSQLETALNMAWNLEQKPSAGIGTIIRRYVTNFSMLAVVSFLLLVSLIASGAVDVFSGAISKILPMSQFLITAVNILLSFGITVFLFAIIYKVLPDMKVSWRMVWGGAIVAALLFTIARFALGFYIATNTTVSAYGAASSLVVLLIWVYFTTQILLFGAEYVKVAAQTSGYIMKPEDYAYRTKIVPASKVVEDSKHAQIDQMIAEQFGLLASKLVGHMLKSDENSAKKNNKSNSTQTKDRSGLPQS